MSDKKCCMIREVGIETGAETHCTNEGVFPYYADHVCEACARAMLPEDVLPIETIAAMIAVDAALYARALGECAIADPHRSSLGEWVTTLRINLGRCARDADELTGDAIAAR